LKGKLLSTTLHAIINNCFFLYLQGPFFIQPFIATPVDGYVVEGEDEYCEFDLEGEVFFNESFVGLHFNGTPFSASDANAEVEMSSAVACTKNVNIPHRILVLDFQFVHSMWSMVSS